MAKPNFRTALRALTYRNYRLFFTGQAVSLIGTWMTRVASSWLVYRLTQDAFLLGLVIFAGQIPSFVLGPFAGVIVDRCRGLRRLIYQTQVAGMLQSLGLVAVAALPLAPMTAVGLLVFLNLIQGVINAFDMPARQAFLPRMVTNKDDLANGIALNGTLFNAARLIGPAVAGALIGVVGELGCFVIDALSYFGVLWALKAMTLPDDLEVETPRTPLWHGIVEGWHYAFRIESIRALLTLVAILSFFGMPYTVLLPIYAKEILHGGAYTFGYLTAASGLGAVLAAIFLAGQTSIVGFGRLIVIAGAIFAVSFFCFAYSTTMVTAVPLLFAAGFGMLMQTTSCNTVIQTIVDPGKRGRVMSLYAMAFVGVAPFGSLSAGYIASKIGAPHTLSICATMCAISTAYFSWRLPAIRRAATAKAATAPAPA